MATEQQKRRRIPWKRWLIVAVLLLLIVSSAVFWAFDSGQPWIQVLPVIVLTVLGILIGLFQWLFPVSDDSQRSTPSLKLAEAAPNASVVPQVIVQMPPMPQAPSTSPIAASEQQGPGNKAAYRSIVAVPPPTDPRTIQQRERAVKEVYVQLIEPNISSIVLTGIGGVGKSTLAALVYQHAEVQRRNGQGPFTAPALWLKIDSPAVTMTDLVGTIFDALGKPLPDLSNLVPHNQAATLSNALNATTAPRLVVLDQFENLLDWKTGYALADHPGIGEWLDALNSQSCTCRILLTSRPWPQGTRGYLPTYMQEYHVKGLEVSEGVELLQKLNAGVGATMDELRTAVERCTGHAFALTLLASLLRTRRLSLNAFFKDPIYAQVWTGNTARNLLDSIYTQQLDAMQRKLLQAFSVYREPVPISAAWAIISASNEMPKGQVQQALDALLTQHLLQAAGEGRYQPHTIVVGYAQEHFDVNDEQSNKQGLQAAHVKAAQYYQQHATLYSPSREKRKQTSDVHALIEAMWHLCESERWQDAYLLMQQEHVFADLERWGDYALLLELYQLVLPERWNAPPAQTTYIYNHLGEVYRSLGQMERASEYFERALQIGKREGLREQEAWTLNYMGRVEAALEYKEKALQHYREALEIFEEDTDGKATVLTNIGWIYYDFGDMQRAQEYYEQALSIRHALHDQRGEAYALNSLGRVYANIGRTEQARTYHMQALHICQEIGYRSGEAWTLNNLGRIYFELNDLPKTQSYLQEALHIRKEIGNRGGEGSTLNNLGRLYLRMKQRDQARLCFEQALTLRREVGDRSGETKTLMNIASIYAEMGDETRAMNYYKQALIIARELGYRRREVKILNAIGQLYSTSSARQHDDIALACFLRSHELFTTILTSYAEDKRTDDETQANIQALQARLGDEQFAELLERVQPQVQKMTDEL